MKKLFLPFLLSLLLPLSYSCSSLGKFGGYTLTENDAAAAIRQLLEIGAQDNTLTGAFSKERVLATVFPEPVRKALNTLDQLGLTSEVDRFTTTMSMAAEKTAERSVPIFVGGIRSMRLTDAVRIVKNGGTSATDYLRASVGDSLRRSIAPVMKATLDEYKITDHWNELTKPVRGLSGNRLNIDLPTLMAGVVSEAMFQKMEERERQIRTQAAARTTPLLQKVFSRTWN